MPWVTKEQYILCCLSSSTERKNETKVVCFKQIHPYKLQLTLMLSVPRPSLYPIRRFNRHRTQVSVTTFPSCNFLKGEPLQVGRERPLFACVLAFLAKVTPAACGHLYDVTVGLQEAQASESVTQYRSPCSLEFIRMLRVIHGCKYKVSASITS